MGHEIDALMDAGIDALRNARFSEAITALRQAADLDPLSARPHNYLGIAWQQQFIMGAQSPENDHYCNEATNSFRRALELDPLNWESLVELGQLTLNTRRPDEARAWYEQALKLRPLDADSWYALGAVARRKFWLGFTADPRPAIDQAIADLNQALTLDPNHLDAMAALAWFLEERARRTDKEPARRPDLVAAITLRRRFRQLEAEAKRNWKCHRPEEPDRDDMLRQSASQAAHPWLMYDPLTRPPGSGSRRGQLREAGIRFEPIDKK